MVQNLNKNFDLKRNLYHNGQISLFLLPALLIFFVVILSPIIVSLILSFFDFTGFDPNYFKQFVKFENFKILFADKVFYIALRNTIYFVLSAITLQVVIAFFMATVIFFGNFKFSVLLRTIIFFPSVLAPVAVSLVWRVLFEQDGVINKILHIDYSWLSNINLAIFLVIFVNIWQFAGYNMIIFYAGLQSIDRTILEAADVDGASWNQKVSKIVIPSMIPVIILNVILNLVGSFRVFDIVYVLTKGGPLHHSEVLTTLMYYYSFASAVGPNKMGVGSSIAFLMFAVMIIFGILRIKLMKQSDL
jgi:raffinose/stachyose/melibiose transport system permease protein